MAASPRRESSLKVSLGDLYATRCPTCGRMLVAEEFIWAAAEPAPEAVARVYRCTVCRDQRGETEIRQAPLDAEDQVRLGADIGADEVRAVIKARFPAVDGAPQLVDELLDLHTPRQLVGLAAIIDRIETDLRAAPVLAALRLAFLHSILPASRLTTAPGRTDTVCRRLVVSAISARPRSWKSGAPVLAEASTSSRIPVGLTDWTVSARPIRPLSSGGAWINASRSPVKRV